MQAEQRGLVDALGNYPSGAELRRQLRERAIRIVTPLVERAHRDGELRADFDALDVLVAMRMLAQVGGALLKLVAVAEPPPLIYGKGSGAHGGYPELKAAIEELVRAQLDASVESLPGDVRSEAAVVSGGHWVLTAGLVFSRAPLARLASLMGALQHRSRRQGVS